MSTDPTTQTIEVPEEHLPAIRYIRRAMIKDGMDWRETAPTKNYCIAMALASGREKCGSTLGLKLREWAQTAPWSPEDDLVDEATPEPDPLPEAADVATIVADATTDAGLFRFLRRAKQTGQTDPEATPEPQTAEPEPAPVVVPEPEIAPAPAPATPVAPASKLGWLRFLPPVASLGLSAVMQVIIVTDVLGHALRARYDGLGGWSFVIACLFGVGIAFALEGSAAYLLDLYRKHLLAQDSVFTLRLMIFGYVGGSAALIHWWTENPVIEPGHLPWVLATVLSVLAGSSILLWIMGSRWENREKMRAQGQLDKAMPRLAGSAKLWHPVRWLVTLSLTSWDPADTTAEARSRYAVWSQTRADRRAAKKAQKQTG